jgi:hypothetical protein
MQPASTEANLLPETSELMRLLRAAEREANGLLDNCTAELGTKAKRFFHSDGLMTDLASKLPGFELKRTSSASTTSIPLAYFSSQLKCN